MENNTTSLTTTTNDLIGSYVIARCINAGVHAGTLQAINGKTVQLKNARRLWRWGNKKGTALSGVAHFGLGNDCKIDTMIESVIVFDVCELIKCTTESQNSISDYGN